jgi:hypothetical protein
LALKRYPNSELVLKALLDAGVQVDETIISADERFSSCGEFITPLMWIAEQPFSSIQAVLSKTLLDFGGMFRHKLLIQVHN